MKIKDLNIKLIVDELKAIYNEANKSFEAFKYDEIKYIILSHLHTSRNISLHGREKFVESFLRRFHTEEINEKNFLKFFDEAKRNYFKTKENNFTLLTSLSIDYLPFRKLKINNSEIHITGMNFPKKYLVHRKEILKKKEKNNFLKVIVNLKGKDHLDVFEQANYDLNIFRAILCLNLNSYSTIAGFSNDKRAINKVRYGEFHTLHYTDSGETINNRTYWYENDIPDKITRFPISNKENQKAVLSSWFKNYENCHKQHKALLSKVFNLYVDAFDELEKQTCFLKSWVALESLLGTHDNHLIIKRCTSVFKKKDRDYQREILKGLRIRRNLIVHENDNRINSLKNCYHVQEYIRNILKYNNLKYSRIIQNKEESIKLLDYRLIDAASLKRELLILKEIDKIKKYES